MLGILASIIQTVIGRVHIWNQVWLFPNPSLGSCARWPPGRMATCWMSVEGVGERIGRQEWRMGHFPARVGPEDFWGSSSDILWAKSELSVSWRGESKPPSQTPEFAFFLPPHLRNPVPLPTWHTKSLTVNDLACFSSQGLSPRCLESDNELSDSGESFSSNHNAHWF
jgi:hypothetical protein